MDDKTGVCKQGKFPVFNTLKRELTRPASTTKRAAVSGYPRGFWSKRYYFYVNSFNSMYYNLNKSNKCLVIVLISYLNLVLKFFKLN